MNSLHSNELQSLFLNVECPFQHLSTKHISARGLPIDLAAASRSNMGRSILLAKFTDFACKAALLDSASKIIDFDQLAKRSILLNSHSPSSLADIFPVTETRSIEDSWAKVGRTGSGLVGHLAMRHAEVFSQSANHSVAAHVVMQEIAAEQNTDVLSYLQTRDAFMPGVLISDDLRGMPIASQDAQALLAYQLIQERWMSRLEIRELNNMILAKPELIPLLLNVQETMCSLLQSFFERYPEHLSGSLAFGEIGLFEMESLRVVPSSRLLKVLLHNLGPWLLEFSEMQIGQQISLAIAKARRELAFEQYIVILEGQENQQRYRGVYRKVCPAKNAIVRILNSIITRKEKLNG